MMKTWQLGSCAPPIGGRHDRPGPAHGADGTNAVKVQISSERCQGHGRCYDLVPDLFGEDEEGYSRLLGDGTVPPGKEREARLAEANCPERAIEVLEEG
jgi:ferredoxin